MVIRSMNKMTLSETKDELLSILVTFDRYCKKHGLRYYLCGGALIGAIRHKGFIPWDDDIDVLMPRPDYETLFNKEKKEKIGTNLELYSYKKGNSNLIFTKLGNPSFEIYNQYQTENEVLSIDIFPLDGLSENMDTNVSNYRHMNILKQIYALHLWRFGQGSSVKIKIMKGIAFPFAKLISHKWICNEMNRIATLFDFESSTYVGDIIWGYGLKEASLKDKFTKEIDVQFENYKFVTTADYDRYLTQVYGDYMKLPPMEKRKNHELLVYRKG